MKVAKSPTEIFFPETWRYLTPKIRGLIPKLSNWGAIILFIYC